MRAILLAIACLCALLPAARADPAPGPLIDTFNYAFTPDPKSVWHGPQQAAGVFVWGHGKNPNSADARGGPLPAYVAAFNAAGFDVVRFDRAPLPDEVNRAAGWLRDGLVAMRARGYRRVVVAGQSRGAWNALQTLDAPGLADVVIAVSPAAHGFGASTNLAAQTDEFRGIVDGAPRQRTRVALIQFQNDFYMGDGDARARMVKSVLGAKTGPVLLIDRPDGLSGHGAGNRPDFADRYAACLVKFATAAAPPDHC